MASLRGPDRRGQVRLPGPSNRTDPPVGGSDPRSRRPSGARSGAGSGGL